MAKIFDKSRLVNELQLALDTPRVPVNAARQWLAETSHREGCQCHRCAWAHGVIAGRIRVSFEAWRKRD